jgi:hypothetical protein
VTKRGVRDVPISYLTVDGIKRLAGQYRDKVMKNEKLQGGDTPSTDAPAEEWQGFLKGQDYTPAGMTVNFNEVKTDAWKGIVSQLWAEYQEKEAEPLQVSDTAYRVVA